LFLVNADSTIGRGHLARSLSLANEFALTVNENQIRFIHWALDPALKDQINFESELFEKAYLKTYLKNVTQKFENLCLTIDSDDQTLHSSEFQKFLNQENIFSAYFTVNNSYSYHCNVLMNPNIIAKFQEYNVSDNTQCFFGPAYFIYNKQYRDTVAQEHREELHTVLITFGNADPMDHTMTILELIENIPIAKKLSFKVVLGKLYTGSKKAIKNIEKSTLDITIYQDVLDMKPIMENVQLAISSLGTTFWELALLNIPSIILPGSLREAETAKILDSNKYANCLLRVEEKVQAQHGDILSQYLENPDQVALKLKELRSEINANGISRLVQDLLQAFNQVSSTINY